MEACCVKNKDWLFSDEKFICGFKSVGVLIKDDKILVQRDKDGTEYALPGGHVIVGETSETSIIREYKEETGTDIICGRMIWVEENFWKWGEKDAHTIAFYYLVALKDGSDIPDNGEFFSQKDNCNVVLKWMSIDEIGGLTIYPTFLKDKIRNISDGIEHFVYNEL